jgi:SAM-dependent methyltransferase
MSSHVLREQRMNTMAPPAAERQTTRQRELAEQFLTPRCTPGNLDRFLVRTALLREVTNTLPRLSGTMLDVGCGRMPYRSLISMPPSRVTQYLGLDLAANPIYKEPPDLTWDGRHIPLPDHTVDCAMATEVLEHCPAPEAVLREIRRVLKPGGVFFFTVPFLWPLHDVPYDEYRYTPFAMRRHLRDVGFEEIALHAMGGWDASLAQMIGLWVRRRPMAGRWRRVASLLALPVMRFLIARDTPPAIDDRPGSMITGLAGTAISPAGGAAERASGHHEPASA